MAGSLAPSVILKFISCKCSHKCQLPSCACIISGRKCTDECKLQDCTNVADAHDASEECNQDNFNIDNKSKMRMKIIMAHKTGTTNV